MRFLPAPSDRIQSWLAGLSLLSLIAFIAFHKSGFAGDPVKGITDKHVELSALWAVFTYSVYARRTIWARMLSFAPLALFGLTIYSTYLFHWIFMEWFAMRSEWWGIPASIVLSIAAGIAGHVLMERPLYAARGPVSRFLCRVLRLERTSVA